MNTRSVVLAATCCAAPLLAQSNNFTVPSKVATYQPGSVYYDSAPQLYPLWGNTGTTVNSRALYLYDAADIPVTSAVLQGLSFRPPVGYQLPAATYQTTVIVSGSNTPVTAPQSNFAANHGPTPTTVFSGSLNVLASTNGSWPRPWQPAIPFATPVVWSNSFASLAVEFQTTGSSNGQIWSLEGIRAEWGFNTSEHYQSNCRNSAGNTSGSWGWNPSGLVPGGSFSLYLYGYPQNSSLSANAMFIGLTGLGSSFGPFVTPFALANLGLAAPANCQWSIGILGGAGYPMSYTASGTSAYLSITGLSLPNTPSFAGAQFYTQDIALDLDPNNATPNLFPSVALRWTIGTGNTVPCAAVTSASSTMPTSGSARASEAASFLISY
ncbi:MAG: hypothetical protein U1F36_02910 [Planctomycetota bacterium]